MRTITEIVAKEHNIALDDSCVNQNHYEINDDDGE